MNNFEANITANILIIFIMEGVEIVQGAIDAFLKQGANILYDKYLIDKIPDHLNRK